MTSLGSSSSSATEYTVRVPKNTSKKYNIMAFNSGDRVNCSTWTQARMERDMSARRIYGEEESEEEKQNEEEAKEEEEEEEGKKTPVQVEKKKKKDSSGESDSSDDSDIEGETASALFMKKRTPPKRGGGRGSAGSSRTGSRPGTPSIDSASTSNTLRAAASKLEQGKRQTPGPSTDSPAAKRLKMEPSSQSPVPSGKTTPQPPSGKSTPSSSDVQLTEEAVRRYLIRKPMTTKDLLKKFQTKRTGLSSEQTVNVLAQILKRLNPERKNVNDKMHFYLTE